jgi:hypothetical protein
VVNAAHPDDMHGPIRHVWIRDGDPRFGHAEELSNEVIAAFAYWVMEPAGDGTVVLPTFSSVLSEIAADRDGVLMPMVVFALARTARNLVRALELERRCTTADILREFLPQPIDGRNGAV